MKNLLLLASLTIVSAAPLPVINMFPKNCLATEKLPSSDPFVACDYGELCCYFVSEFGESL